MNINKITAAMSNYNSTHERHFILIDSLIMQTIASGVHATDEELAHLTMSSTRTVKRSINKLCTFGLIKKHLAHDNTKSLELQQDALDHFISTYTKE